MSKLNRNLIYSYYILYIFYISIYYSEMYRYINRILIFSINLLFNIICLQNRGIYMFRLDEERVVDATLCGGLARYINHSCNPNCVAEIVEVERDLRIIIFAKRRISRGEEVKSFKTNFFNSFTLNLFFYFNPIILDILYLSIYFFFQLAYDYKFDIEDDQHKIACACGAPNCRKWMN